MSTTGDLDDESLQDEMEALGEGAQDVQNSGVPGGTNEVDTSSNPVDQLKEKVSKENDNEVVEDDKPEEDVDMQPETVDSSEKEILKDVQSPETVLEGDDTTSTEQVKEKSSKENDNDTIVEAALQDDETIQSKEVETVGSGEKEKPKDVQNVETTLQSDDDVVEVEDDVIALDEDTLNSTNQVKGKVSKENDNVSEDKLQEDEDMESKEVDSTENDKPKSVQNAEKVVESEDDEDANMPMITVRKDGLFADEEEEEDQSEVDVNALMQVDMGEQEESSISSRPRRRAAAAAANVIREISQEESKELEIRRKSREKSLEQLQQQPMSGERHRCYVCKKITTCNISVQQYGQDIFLCSTACFNAFRNPDATRRLLPCAKCGIIQRDNGFSTYYWETMNFCSDLCIGNFQMEIGSKCATCAKKVAWQSLGKYCVRFGSDVRQFCSAACLESYKKNARVCFHCQLDIKKLSNVILANIPTKATPKEFCSQDCVEMYIEQNLHQTVRTKPNQNSNCVICSTLKPTFRELVQPQSTSKVCCEQCWTTLIEVKNIRNPTKCEICTKYVNLELGIIKPAFYVSTQKKVHGFCSATCKNVFVLKNRQILACTSCKVKKYNYDLIQHVNEAETPTFAVCSLNCIPKPSQYIINLRDTLTPASTASEMFTKSRLLQEKQMGNVGTGSRIRTTIMSADGDRTMETDDGALRISSVSSLAKNDQGPYRFDMATGDDVIEIYDEVPGSEDALEITEEEMDELLEQADNFLLFPMTEPIEKKNKSCLVRPFTTTVGIQVESEELGEKVKEKYIPIFIPYYVPFPFYGFDSPTPIPLPVPLPVPIPIPILIPSTTTTTAAESSKTSISQNVAAMSINTVPIPMDQQQQHQQDSSFRGTTETESSVEIPENMRLDSVEFLDLTGPMGPSPFDMESDMSKSTGPNVGEGDNFDYLSTIPSLDMELNLGVGTSHGIHPAHSLMNPGGGMMSTGADMIHGIVNPMENPNVNTLGHWQPHVMSSAIPIAPVPPKLTREEYAFRAWKHYFGHDCDPSFISADVLANKLAEWVDKGQKPNGDRYKPSFLLYLCLGIQEYLRHNQRNDKIFYDPVYEPFIQAFTNYANYTQGMQGLESPIDDYHLWESSELGVSSPQVLVFTLIYLNYKYFHLQTWQEHAGLRFEQIVVMERISSSGRKVKYMTIQGLAQKYDVPEIQSNPKKCPIILFEFYKHKCVSATGKLYKAIIPHCPKAADWFSTDALDEMQIYRMLMRAIMIKG